MRYIENPILKGFNPDPSICRVGEDFYIATSTFEWFPGVQIHHSKDLKNWNLISHPLNRLSQLDLKGVPDSCGIWAPCLSYHKGTFYLVYSNVKSFDGVWKDSPNYLVTAKDIQGDWSDPIYLNSSGFDGSLFHDAGKIWYTNMIVDHRNGKFFGGIELHEYDQKNETLLENGFYLTDGTKIGLSEGPHLYKYNDYYYLLLAEGGTEYGHAASMLRSRNIEGPYEEHPENPFLTSRNHPNHPLQKSGHASMIETNDGRWYIVFLVGRPLSTHGRCILGRETAIEELVWKNDWPYLNGPGGLPRVKIPPYKSSEYRFKEEQSRMYFNQKTLPIEFQSLRIPLDENWISNNEREGHLRLKGKESLTSTHNQSMLARRLQHFEAHASTSIDFNPDNFQQMAGLVVYYNTGHYHYLHITKRNDDKILSIISADNFRPIEDSEKVVITRFDKIILKAKISRNQLQFCYSYDDVNYINIGAVLDMTILSDDYVRNELDRYRPAFTGCFICICCQDLKNNKKHADFEWFEYKGIN